jgi:N-acetylneuraminic acid mutarotase
MKEKHTTQLRHDAARTRRISVSTPARESSLLAKTFGVRSSLGKGGFVRPRALLSLLLCSAAACSMLSGALLAFFRSDAPSNRPERTLTFAERVAYQRATEEIYWRHRIWPKANAAPKPPLDKVMSQAQIEKKVEDYLRDSKALEDYWQRPITPEQLQAEMERMASHTKQPEVLHELFDALGNDPFLIAECLAGPAVAERLVTNVYANDQEPLDSGRARAENQKPKLMATASANYTLPAISGKPNGCIDDTWTATSTTNVPSARDFHTSVWTGSEMIVWGGAGFGGLFNTGGRYNPTTDTWTATSITNAPTGRISHTAVWTGSEMIVWGGADGTSYLNTGGRYNPSTDSWTATRTTNTPAGRFAHTAVWTGGEMIVWGGYDATTYFNTGGRYNPSTDSWTATSTANAPSARFNHTAVWTGGEMIVWGGDLASGNRFNTGARYDPGTDSWAATSTINAPSARYAHTAVWTGSEMIVWGGSDLSGYVITGGRYNPGMDSWTATSTTNAPPARGGHTAVWTGSEMIVWGGDNGSQLNTGGRYNPGTDNWAATSTTNAPSARYLHTAVWTGSEMIVWGGYRFYLNTGGRYCAQLGAPSPTPTSTATATATPTTTATATPTATAIPTATPTSTPRPSPTPRVAPTPRPRRTPPPRP